MAGKDILDITLATVDPELLCLKGKAEHGVECSLLSKDRKIYYYRVGSFLNWSPPKFSKYNIPCKLAMNFFKCQRL